MYDICLLADVGSIYKKAVAPKNMPSYISICGLVFTSNSKRVEMKLNTNIFTFNILLKSHQQVILLKSHQKFILPKFN